jgi:hypothetical protein
MSSNVDSLIDFISSKEKGQIIEIATSGYAGICGATFDFHSTAQAVRAVEKRGIIKAESMWRYYRVEVL